MVQAHTIRIDNFYGWAQEVTMPKMFKSREQIEVPIDGGDNIWYYGSMKLRTFQCTLTLYGEHSDIRKQLEGLVDRIVPFSSDYIGSFNAMIEIEGDVIDGTPNMLKVKISVQEVG